MHQVKFNTIHTQVHKLFFNLSVAWMHKFRNYYVPHLGSAEEAGTGSTVAAGSTWLLPRPMGQGETTRQRSCGAPQRDWRESWCDSTKAAAEGMQNYKQIREIWQFYFLIINHFYNSVFLFWNIFLKSTNQIWIPNIFCKHWTLFENVIFFKKKIKIKIVHIFEQFMKHKYF